MSQDEKNPWKTLHTKTAYENAWIEVRHSDVINPSGNPGIYGVVHFKNIAVGVIPIDEEGNTWLVGQYRYTLNAYSWEIPEGGCPIEETPLEAGKRELLEETGLVASEWEEIQRMHLSNSVSDEVAVIYVAKGLSQVAPCPEETEQLRLRKLPLQEAIDMVLRGEITDSMSVAGLLLLKVRR